jgi:hypothetical protein
MAAVIPGKVRQMIIQKNPMIYAVVLSAAATASKLSNSTQRLCISEAVGLLWRCDRAVLAVQTCAAAAAAADSMQAYNLKKSSSCSVQHIMSALRVYCSADQAVSPMQV